MHLILDFDCTLSEGMVYDNLGGGRRDLAEQMRLPWWIKQFGGKARLKILNDVLDVLGNLGVQPYICSHNSTEVIEIALERVGLGRFFTEASGEFRIIGSPGTDKAKRIQWHLERTETCARDACFVDDSVQNCRSVKRAIPELRVFTCNSATGLTKSDCLQFIAHFSRLAESRRQSARQGVHREHESVHIAGSVHAPLARRRSLGLALHVHNDGAKTERAVQPDLVEIASATPVTCVHERDASIRALPGSCQVGRSPKCADRSSLLLSEPPSTPRNMPASRCYLRRSIATPCLRSAERTPAQPCSERTATEGPLANARDRSASARSLRRFSLVSNGDPPAQPDTAQTAAALAGSLATSQHAPACVQSTQRSLVVPNSWQVDDPQVQSRSVKSLPQPGPLATTQDRSTSERCLRRFSLVAKMLPAGEPPVPNASPMDETPAQLGSQWTPAAAAQAHSPASVPGTPDSMHFRYLGVPSFTPASTPRVSSCPRRQAQAAHQPLRLRSRPSVARTPMRAEDEIVICGDATDYAFDSERASVTCPSSAKLEVTKAKRLSVSTLGGA